MKVLITGGAGFIGSHVAEAYLRAGHEVVIVDNLRSGRELNLPAGARFYLLDLGAEELDAVFRLEQPEVVNHHAAQVSVTVSARDPLLDARINSAGLLNVLECCARHDVGRVIFISSGGAIYGDIEPRPTPETVNPHPLSPYGIHKLVGEHYLAFYQHQHGIRSTALRYGNVYGPRQDPHGEAGVVSIFTELLLAGKQPTIFAYPEEPAGMSRDYVYVEDVAQANLQALELGVDGAFNIAAGRPVRTRELFEAIRDVVGAKVEAKEAPARAAELKESWLDIGKAAAELRWKPTTSLADGLSKTAHYFRDAAP